MDVKLSKGADIKIKCVADRVYANIPLSNFYAIKPTDFHFLTPKLQYVLVSLEDGLLRSRTL